MKNFVQIGDSIDVEWPRDVEAGEPFNIGFISGVVVCSGLKGQRGVLSTRGVFEFEKPLEGDWLLGQRIGVEDGKLVQKGGVGFGVIVGEGERIKVKLWGF